MIVEGRGFVFNTGDGDGVEIMWGSITREEGDVGNARGWGQGAQAACRLCIPIEAFHGAPFSRILFTAHLLWLPRAPPGKRLPLFPRGSSVSSTVQVTRWMLMNE